MGRDFAAELTLNLNQNWFGDMSQNLDAEEVLKQVIPHFIGQIERA